MKNIKETIEDLIGLRIMEKPVLDSIGWFSIHKSVGKFVWNLVWDSVVKPVWNSVENSICDFVENSVKGLTMEKTK